MVIYEVNLAVEREVAAAFCEWLDAHVRTILRIDGFEGATWLEPLPLPHAQDERLRITIQYRLRDAQFLERYLAEHAPALRQDGLDRFPGRFEATRRVLAVRSTFDPPPPSETASG